jgi:hypothetical protein
MWVLFFARQRGAEVDVRALRPRSKWGEALVLSEGCNALQVPEGLVPEGPPFESWPLGGQRFRVERQASR